MINTLDTLDVLWCCDGFGVVVVCVNKREDTVDYTVPFLNLRMKLSCLVILKSHLLCTF